MGLFGKFFGNSPTLNSVTFDHSAFAYQGERDGAKIWYLKEGGGIGLYFFPRAPDLPRDLASAADLQKFYSSQLSAKQRLLEFREQSIDDVKGIWMITADTDPKTGGSVYLGSITLPFQKFSYVIKVQCQELGTTGVREAMVIDWAMKNGKASVLDGRLQMDGFSPEDERFDQIVPGHPLTRVRKVLRHIRETARIDPATKAHARFELP